MAAIKKFKILYNIGDNCNTHIYINMWNKRKESRMLIIESVVLLRDFQSFPEVRQVGALRLSSFY